jgi:hypothetical protein
MRKILVLGDSHVFRLIEENNNEKTSHYQFDFISAIGQVVNMFIIENDILNLRPFNKISLHKQQVKNLRLWYDQCLMQLKNIKKLSDYDSIIIVSCGLVDGTWHKFDLKKAYSSALMRDFLLENIKNKAHYKLINMIDNSQSTAKLFSIPTPLVNELIFDPQHNQQPQLKHYRKIPPTGNFKLILPLYKEVLGSLNSELLPLPDNIYNKDFNATAATFKILTRDDFGHLNNAGAKFVLLAIHQTLDAYFNSL